MKLAIEKRTETITYNRPVLRLTTSEYNKFLNALTNALKQLGDQLETGDKIVSIEIVTEKGKTLSCEVVIDETAA